MSRGRDDDGDAGDEADPDDGGGAPNGALPGLYRHADLAAYMEDVRARTSPARANVKLEMVFPGGLKVAVKMLALLRPGAKPKRIRVGAVVVRGCSGLGDRGGGHGAGRGVGWGGLGVGVRGGVGGWDGVWWVVEGECVRGVRQGSTVAPTHAATHEQQERLGSCAAARNHTKQGTEPELQARSNMAHASPKKVTRDEYQEVKSSAALVHPAGNLLRWAAAGRRERAAGEACGLGGA